MAFGKRAFGWRLALVGEGWSRTLRLRKAVMRGFVERAIDAGIDIDREKSLECGAVDGGVSHLDDLGRSYVANNAERRNLVPADEVVH